MDRITIKRSETGFFTELANKINENQEALDHYIQQPISLTSFEQQILLKKEHFSLSQRHLIQEVFTEQLSSYFHHQKLKENVRLIGEETTFTITSGHQLNLFGGPLYVIYKVLDAVNLCEQLQAKYTNYNFVPVFWLATEDHDFEEINHLHLFNETFSWETNQKGPIGRFSLEGIDKLKSEIALKFQNNPEFSEFINQQYQEGSLAKETVRFLMEIVGEYGVLILDADHTKLKASFAQLIKKELETQFAEEAILQTTKSLEKDGFQGQAHARPVNLFYIQDQLRERIVPINASEFEIGERIVSKTDLLKELEAHPERFSPNVVFRPLYQEHVLPNLCYIGGGGEMAYWLQLKGVFDSAGIPYPLIKVRNSIQWIDKNSVKRLEKLGLVYKDIFEPIDEVKKRFVIENSGGELDFNELNQKAQDYTHALEKSIVDVDKGLEGYAKSELTRIQKQLEGIQQKLIRHHKKSNENAMMQIDGVYERMFPNNGLQERYDNMIPFLEKFGVQEYIKQVYALIDSFEKDLILAIE